MSDQKQPTLEQTFISVVEKLTFMFGEQIEPDEIEAGPEPWVQSSIGLTGDVTGSLAVIVPTSLQPEIAANILGLDAEGLDTKEVLDDALGEVLNVVCGHVIMALAGQGANFQITPPVISVLSLDDRDAALADTDTTAYLLDEEPVLLNLKLTQE